MEVGAVKQAFNNEVIQLKKKLNQAKIQTIHKLTRKAKTFTEKKAPEHLKEKLKRKAESAVNEVLIIKKIKAKDIAKFMITHTGEVSDYLNRPKVDNDKACARLILHKSLQDKYKFIRNKYGDIPIKDLFMSRQERRKLKKEAKEQQKNKKKGKGSKLTNSAGDWNVEEMKIGDGKGVKNEDSNDEIGDESDNSECKRSEQSEDENDSDIEQESATDKERSDDDEMKNYSDDDLEENNSKNDEFAEEDIDKSDSDNEEVGKLLKLKPKIKVKPEQQPKPPKIKSITNTITPIVETLPKRKSTSIIEPIDKMITELEQKTTEIRQKNKKIKENKNKNLKEKLQTRKFKKINEDHVESTKVVDPFFKTATGENYLSVAEPRLPDEIKEVHKQGNRQERRAAMFGRKFKPRNGFPQNNFRAIKFDNEKHDKRNSDGSGNRNDRFGDGNGKFNDRSGKFGDRNSKFNDKKDRFNNNKFSNNVEEKEEKLHPSWEAKRKLKSMPLLPSQGKKIVFDDN